MAMTAKTKAERVKRLEARIEKIVKSKRELMKRYESLEQDRMTAQRELEWVKSAPTADGEPDEPQVYEPANPAGVVSAPAASPAEVVSTPVIRASDAV